MQTTKFMSLLPLLVCFSCSRILILLYCLMFLPLCPCPCPCPNPTSLNIFVLISPPLSSISIGMPLLIQRVVLRGRWLTRESSIFDRHYHICWNDTTCIALKIPHEGSLTLIPIDGTIPTKLLHGPSIC